ncbi:MAG: 30S ribosomal protein S20 [Planctomycetes bacterium]|jgi:small subunit ribosomal protein S20|nr:30S ribosomal protein S20 [Planctomycetota bacterium]
MPHSISARKRVRQNEKRRENNKAVKSTVRTQVKKVRAAITAGDTAKAEQALKAATKKLDKAARANVIHQNQASRRKARLQQAVNKLKAEKPAAPPAPPPAAPPA